MHKPKILNGWNFRDTIEVPNGYDSKDIPDLTRDNFNQLLDEYNNLVEVVNMLVDNANLSSYPHKPIQFTGKR